MKNLKNIIATLTFACLIGFASCSKEDEPIVDNITDSTMQKTVAEVNALAATYVTIMSTTNYTNFKNTKLLMANKLNNIICPMETKAVFLAWINSNLSRTKFTSAIEAGILYDRGITTSTALVNTNTAFYNELKKCTKSELHVIFAPEFVHPTLVALSACESGCADWAAGAFADNDANYADGMSSWNPVQSWVSGAYHAAAEAAITETFQGCISDCN